MSSNKKKGIAKVIPIDSASKHNFDLKDFSVAQEATVRDLVACLNKNQSGAALIVDGVGKLLDIITDGDVRRAILNGVTLDSSAQVLSERRSSSILKKPVTAQIGTSTEDLLALMRTNFVRQVPLLNARNQVVDIAFLNEFVSDAELPKKALVMAGGFGKRLRPLTFNCPKPMLPVKGRPILEIIIEKLRRTGVKQVLLSTHYKAEHISNHFKNGKNFGLDIHYIKEQSPMGTAGSLSKVPAQEEPVFVLNADIISDIDYRSMARFHQDEQAGLTIAVREYEAKIPFGVIETDGPLVTKITEKPVIKKFINAGIYLFGPKAFGLIPDSGKLDMPELVEHLITNDCKVVSFPVHEEWIDIGHPEDYKKVK